MAIAIVLLVLVVGSVAFHLLTPWTLTPLASNWEQMDHTLSITIGKNDNRNVISTFGMNPKPNQMMNSGASAIFGMIWLKIIIGQTVRVKSGE